MTKICKAKLMFIFESLFIPMRIKGIKKALRSRKAFVLKYWDTKVHSPDW